MTRVAAVVAGGGVTGLVAAYELAGAGLEVVLLEAEPSLGGKLVTTTWRGRPLDLGPDAFITRNPAAAQLCRELGLGDQLVAPSSSQAAVWAGGRLRPFPRGLVLGIPTDLRALARSGIVSRSGTARCALDLLLPGPNRAGLAEAAREGGEDPTIAQVVAPRLGAEVFGKLVDPLLGGINAGDSHRLSFAAAAPTLAERLGGPSLIRALRATASAGGAGLGAATPSTGRPGGTGAQGGAGAPAGRAPDPVFLGLEQGMSALAGRLAQRCEERGVSLRTGARLERVGRDPDGGYVVQATGLEELHTPRLVLALPATSSGRALAGSSPQLATACAAIPYAGVALVTAAFAAAELSGRTPGSGVLVPRARGRSLTAATFVSVKWPRSAPRGEVVVRASLGHHGDDDVVGLDDDALASRALSELRPLLGTAAVPLEVRVQRWPESFPQYVSGHLALVARIERLLGELPGLELAGAAYRGIGIPACVDDGRRAARRLAALA